jgi:hypothetical protein
VVDVHQCGRHSHPHATHTEMPKGSTTTCGGISYTLGRSGELATLISTDAGTNWLSDIGRRRGGADDRGDFACHDVSRCVPNAPQARLEASLTSLTASTTLTPLTRSTTLDVAYPAGTLAKHTWCVWPRLLSSLKSTSYPTAVAPTSVSPSLSPPLFCSAPLYFFINPRTLPTPSPRRGHRKLLASHSYQRTAAKCK